MYRITSFLVFLILVVMTSASSPENYYVDINNGSNANEGISPDSPWKTLSHAFLIVEGTEKEPAIIHVAKGRYCMEKGEAFPFIMKSNVMIIGEDKETTILDAYKCYSTIFECIYVRNIVISGFTFTNGTGKLIDGG